MPTLDSFDGIQIVMAREVGVPHNEPHIHAKYAEFYASFSFDGRKLSPGPFPNREARKVQNWLHTYKNQLALMWTKLSTGQNPGKLQKEEN